MRWRVTLGETTVEVELGPDGIRVDGRIVDAELRALPGGAVRSLRIDGAVHRLLARSPEPGTWDLHLRGWRLAAEVLDERTERIRRLTHASVASGGPRPVRAPMPGLVVRVEVGEGDAVEPGQAIVIVEAMKMENEIRAEVAGRVGTVHVRPGQAVEKDQVLVDLGPAEDR